MCMSLKRYEQPTSLIFLTHNEVTIKISKFFTYLFAHIIINFIIQNLLEQKKCLCLNIKNLWTTLVLLDNKITKK